MIRIIDATLCMLDDYNLTREQIYCFLKLMKEIGINNVQISLAIYNSLDGKLPEGIHYFLEVDTASYINEEYPKDENIKYYFIPKQKNTDREIGTYQINDLEEPIRITGPGENGWIKIIGLDKLLLGGCNVGIDALKKRFPLKQLILCPEDTFHCATAIATLFLQEKGYAVVTSMMGIGNKAATEQVIMAMHVLERYMARHEFQGFVKVKDWLSEVLQTEISPMAAVLGSRIFYVESGIHVDGILKKPSNYEPYPPELVGLERKVILGKHSGKSAIAVQLGKCNLESGKEGCLEQLLQSVKEKVRVSGKMISDEEFIQMAKGSGFYEKDTEHC